MKDAQKIWVELLGSQADGFGDIAVSLVEFSKQLSQIESKYNDLAKQGKEADEAGQTRFGETSKAVAQSIAATAVGMRKMFEEGSNGYKAMTALAGAAALAQDAVNIADGIGAILKQLKDGDVYTAIPRAIAVAGMVAQLIGHAVSTIAAVGGGAKGVTSEDRQKPKAPALFLVTPPRSPTPSPTRLRSSSRTVATTSTTRQPCCGRWKTSATASWRWPTKSPLL
jgi:hypothetical protein